MSRSVPDADATPPDRYPDFAIWCEDDGVHVLPAHLAGADDLERAAVQMLELAACMLRGMYGLSEEAAYQRLALQAMLLDLPTQEDPQP